MFDIVTHKSTVKKMSRPSDKTSAEIAGFRGDVSYFFCKTVIFELEKLLNKETDGVLTGLARNLAISTLICQDGI